MTDTETPKTLTIEDVMARLDDSPLWRRMYYSTLRAARTPRKIRRYFRTFWQRGRRGYGESDTWGFDHYLSGVIAGGLASLRERSIGYPAGMSEATWDEALDEMIAGFRAAAKGSWDMTEEDRETFERGAAVFVKHYFSLWD